MDVEGMLKGRDVEGTGCCRDESDESDERDESDESEGRKD